MQNHFLKSKIFILVIFSTNSIMYIEDNQIKILFILKFWFLFQKTTKLTIST